MHVSHTVLSTFLTKLCNENLSKCQDIIYLILSIVNMLDIDHFTDISNCGGKEEGCIMERETYYNIHLPKDGLATCACWKDVKLLNPYNCT